MRHKWNTFFLLIFVYTMMLQPSLWSFCGKTTKDDDLATKHLAIQLWPTNNWVECLVRCSLLPRIAAKSIQMYNLFRYLHLVWYIDREHIIEYHLSQIVSLKTISPCLLVMQLILDDLLITRWQILIFIQKVEYF